MNARIPSTEAPAPSPSKVVFQNRSWLDGGIRTVNHLIFHSPVIYLLALVTTQAHVKKKADGDDLFFLFFHQILDRFETSSRKTNPGVAIFSCSFTASSGQALSPADIKAALGDFSAASWISQSSSIYIDRTLNNSFTHVNMGPEKAIYCFVGDPEIPSEFMFIRLPPRQFFGKH